VIGNREMVQGQVAVRLRTEENLGATAVVDLLTMTKDASAEKRDLISAHEYSG